MSIVAPEPGYAGWSGEDSTIGGLLSMVVGRLRVAGIANARRDARVLVCHVTGLGETTVVGYPERPIGSELAGAVGALALRRAKGEPLSRVLGRREFWSLEFALSPDTLDPRPDSETLIDAVLARNPDTQQPLRILDLGTGSGCLLLALLSELPRAFGVGVDLSSGACAAAAENARRLGLSERAVFVASDWSSAIGGAFDIVVSNPPYIPSREAGSLSPEVLDYDPALALFGGEDGLSAYRTIASSLGCLLLPGGFVGLEVGAGQQADVTRILAEQGLTVRSVHRDLAGIERCIVAYARIP